MTNTIPAWLQNMNWSETHRCGWNLAIDRSGDVNQIDIGGNLIQNTSAAINTSSDGASISFVCPNSACGQTVTVACPVLD